MDRGNKLLLPWQGRTILDTVVEEISRSGCSRLVVVVNDMTRRLAESRGYPFVINAEYENGMTSSIQKGVDALHSTDAFMICPGDLPLIQASEYAAVMDAFQEKVKSDPNIIIVPKYKGQKGHPVIFSKSYREAILNHDEPEGCSGIVRENREHIAEIEIDSESGIQDVDTREEYVRLIGER